ncbi:DUF1566 domain-containing protein [Moritella marina]|uniref:Lcl C-terminal domain-containing protein n=1 Tax=Moritella marina TaxID=90736 RepID=UPI0037041EB9
MIKTLLCISLMTIMGLPAIAQVKNEYIKASHIEGQYIDNKNGIITDVVNELMWSRCSLAIGQSFTDVDCTAQTHFSTWESALKAVEYFNDADDTTYVNDSGFNDWRLPNIKELSSLVARSYAKPTINLVLFPSTPSVPYWSNTFNTMDIYSDPGIKGLLIDFEHGSDVINERSNRLVRLVRDIPSQ